MTITQKQISEYLGVSERTFRRYSLGKRMRLMIDCQNDINQKIAAMSGALSVVCYKASVIKGLNVCYDPFYSKSYSFYSVSYRKPGEEELTYIDDNMTELTEVNLTKSLKKVMELCYV